MKSIPVLALAFGLWLSGGCGYTIGSKAEIRNVTVPVFENKTMWRMNEFDLTGVVTHELQARGIRVNHDDAPWILIGEIVDFSEPRWVEGILDEVLVGSVTVSLRITVKNRRTGAVYLTETTSAAAPITAGRGKTEDWAKMQVYDQLAVWVATRLDKKW